MSFNIINYLLLLVCSVQVVICYTNRGDFIPERPCATLFDKRNFGGLSFRMQDFDQSANLKWDYRTSVAGWNNTGSVKVESGCTLAVCNDSYFLGNCYLLTSDVPNIGVISRVRSANCTCHRECRCEDIYIGKDEKARAYLEGGCSTCDSQYICLVNRLSHSFALPTSVEELYGMMTTNHTFSSHPCRTQIR